MSHWIGVFASKVGRDRPAVEIRVADHGPGIPEHEQRRIFDPFFRGARAVQDQIHGTGFGLEPGEEDRGSARRQHPREERADARNRIHRAYSRGAGGAA